MKTSTDLVHSAKDAVQKLATQAQEFAHRDPKQATASVIGIGLGLRLLPTRLIFRAITLAAGSLARPALLTLGTLKAYELYRSSNQARPKQQILPDQSKTHLREANF